MKKIFLLYLIFNLFYTDAYSIPLNDIHSKLNKSDVKEIIYPQSIQDIQNAVHLAKQQGLSISISAGKHAMGGQQFGQNTLHLDMSKYTKILNFDNERGIIEVESGIE